jgi:hypothetical protein
MSKAIDALIARFEAAPETALTDGERRVLRTELVQGRLEAAPCDDGTPEESVCRNLEDEGTATPTTEVAVAGALGRERTTSGQTFRVGYITYTSHIRRIQLFTWGTVLSWDWSPDFRVRAANSPFNSKSKFGWTYKGVQVQTCAPISCTGTGSVATKAVASYDYRFARFLGTFDRQVSVHADVTHIHGGSLTGVLYGG